MLLLSPKNFGLLLKRLFTADDAETGCLFGADVDRERACGGGVLLTWFTRGCVDGVLCTDGCVLGLLSCAGECTGLDVAGCVCAGKCTCPCITGCVCAGECTGLCITGCVCAGECTCLCITGCVCAGECTGLAVAGFVCASTVLCSVGWDCDGGAITGCLGKTGRTGAVILGRFLEIC